jgi:hypothetical protein
MHVAVYSIFAVSKSEPLASTLERVHAAFTAAGFGEPSIQFRLSDHVAITEPAILAETHGMKRVSSVARVLQRFPEMQQFARAAPATASGPGATRVLSNLSATGPVIPANFATLLEIARLVPKSLPFHKAWFQFAAPGFSDGPAMPAVLDQATASQLLRAGVDLGAGHPTTPGVSVQDSWWVNGRVRSMAALRIVEADPSARKFPPPPAAVAAVLAASGKIRKTTQVPVVVAAEPTSPPPPRIDAAASAGGEAIRAVVRTWRARLPELQETLPHDLSPRDAAAAAMPASGPKKPELVRAFAPMGYDCHGGIGTFRLRRRTAANLTVELDLDVGTWSNALMAFFRVQGLIDGQGFKATLNLPPARHAVRGTVHGAEIYGQFPIGGPERWSQIVDNLAALVAALDRDFVPEVEAAAGPSPEWYRPEA